jgi:hypothetical protein
MPLKPPVFRPTHLGPKRERQHQLKRLDQRGFGRNSTQYWFHVIVGPQAQALHAPVLGQHLQRLLDISHDHAAAAAPTLSDLPD